MSTPKKWKWSTQVPKETEAEMCAEAVWQEEHPLFVEMDRLYKEAGEYHGKAARSGGSVSGDISRWFYNTLIKFNLKLE